MAKTPLKLKQITTLQAGDRVQADKANGLRKGTVDSFGMICGLPAVSIVFDGDGGRGTFMQRAYVNINFLLICK